MCFVQLLTAIFLCNLGNNQTTLPMKPLLFLAVITCVFFACGTGTEESGESAETDTTTVESRYTYSSSFEMADKANLEIVRNWNNAIVAMDLDLAFSYVADSIDVILADGTAFDTTRDSLRVVINQFMEEFSNINVDFIAGVTVTSTDMNDTWVLSYTDEYFTSEEGEERSIIHELYRIVDGKIRSLYQYAQVPSEIDVFEDPQDGDYIYSGSFEMMDNQHTDIVNGWMDALVDKDWDTAGSFLSDSVTVIFSDGSYINTVRDSLIAEARGFFEDATIEIEFAAAMAVKSTVQGDEYVLSWTNETYIRPDTTESTILHEVYQIVDNKISFVRQFARVAPEE